MIMLRLLLTVILEILEGILFGIICGVRNAWCWTLHYEKRWYIGEYKNGDRVRTHYCSACERSWEEEIRE